MWELERDVRITIGISVIKENFLEQTLYNIPNRLASSRQGGRLARSRLTACSAFPAGPGATKYMAVLSNKGFLDRLKFYLNGSDCHAESDKWHSSLQANTAHGQECTVTVMGSSHTGKGKLQLRSSSSDEPKQPLVTRISRHT